MTNLIERNDQLALLSSAFSRTANGEGHCVFVSGEAGIGKTSLVNGFCAGLKKPVSVYQGNCDALFSPRPLAPVFDLARQINFAVDAVLPEAGERLSLFSTLLQRLSETSFRTVIVFEDVHWADEATLDFIRFFSRRINQAPCLFICTYRDNEIDHHHPLRQILGQLPASLFTRIPVPSLSLASVEKLATEKGFNGRQVFEIAGGNPFYVNEIINHSPGTIPENVRDAILFTYNRQTQAVKDLWNLLSVMPAGLDMADTDLLGSDAAAALERSMQSGALQLKDQSIIFKHELYRLAIESFLTQLKQREINLQVLHLFSDRFLQRNMPERIVHHAKAAHEAKSVVTYAPRAAALAATSGAHLQAAQLYKTAIDYCAPGDKIVLNGFYHSYAYECYLTNQLAEAISAQERYCDGIDEVLSPQVKGNAYRFLSRLWWYQGNRKNAEQYAAKAVAAFEQQPASSEKAMAFSNMSQLNMLSDQTEACIAWGNKAVEIATALNDQEILSHAYNNIGTVQLRTADTHEAGKRYLEESLRLALAHKYHEHAARAYTNLSSALVTMKSLTEGQRYLEEGIRYCELNDLDSWRAYMQGYYAKLKLDQGYLPEAAELARVLLENSRQAKVVQLAAMVVAATAGVRRGDADMQLLERLKAMAFETSELQRIVPAFVAFLEFEWINGRQLVTDEELKNAATQLQATSGRFNGNEFAFWLRKTKRVIPGFEPGETGYDYTDIASASAAAAYWQQKQCPYEEALALIETGAAGQSRALRLLQQSGATAVLEKIKSDLRKKGFRKIPRGPRKTTTANNATLTSRELDILRLLQTGNRNKEIAATLFISPKTVDHHISSILLKLDANSRIKAVQEALKRKILL